MKKITFIISSLGAGGAERVISIISKELSKYYKVSIILLLNSKSRAYEVDKNVEIIEIPRFDGRVTKWLNIILYLRTLIKKLNTDIYISFCTVENVVSLIANFGINKKIIISERNAPKVEKKSILIKLLQKTLYAHSNCIVFQTEYAQSLYPKEIRNKSVVIPNPIVSGLPTWNKKYKEEKYICAVGRLNTQKLSITYQFIFEFSKIYLDYKLIIFGDGPEKDELLELVNHLNLKDKITFMGVRKDVHDYLQNCQFYVMTSDYEGMPNALMEAMSMGVPSICTDCPAGGPAKLITHGKNGFLIEVNNREQLIKYMLYLSDDKEKALQISKNAIEIKKEYDTTIIGYKWKKIIEDVDKL